MPGFDDGAKIMPSAPEIERAVLCSMIISEKSFNYAKAINPEFFYTEKHRAIFSYMVENTTRDLVLITNKFPTMIDLITDIMESNSAQDIAPYIDVLHDRYVRRKTVEIMIATQTSMLSDYETSANDQYATLHDAIASLVSDRKVSEPEAIGQILPRVFDHIEKIKNSGSGYINTGLIDIDEIIGTFSPGELVIVAARPGMGKSTLAANIVRHNAINKRIPTLIFSLEMDKVLSAGRILFAEAEACYDNATKNRIPVVELQKVGLKASEIMNAPIIIDDTPAITLNEIISKSEIQHKKHTLGLIIIDHMQLIGIKKQGRSRNEEIGVLSSGLKTLARTLNLPVICLSQLSREVERRSPPRPMLSDLRDSGNIEQDADKVIFLYRPEYYKPEEKKGLCEIIVGKNRNGPEGYRDVGFNKNTMNFYNCINDNVTDYNGWEQT